MQHINNFVLNEYCMQNTCRGCKFSRLCEEKQLEEDLELYKQKKERNDDYAKEWEQNDNDRRTNSETI